MMPFSSATVIACAGSVMFGSSQASPAPSTSPLRRQTRKLFIGQVEEVRLLSLDDFPGRGIGALDLLVEWGTNVAVGSPSKNRA